MQGHSGKGAGGWVGFRRRTHKHPNPGLSRPRPAPYCEAMSDALKWASPMPFWALLFMENGKEDPVPLELAQKGTFPFGTFLLASLITL